MKVGRDHIAHATAAAPAAAEVVETSSQGFVTQDMAEVAASPMETWLALIRPGEWWNDAHTWSADAANMTLTPQAGGCFCERVPGDDRDPAPAVGGGCDESLPFGWGERQSNLSERELVRRGRGGWRGLGRRQW